MTSRQDDYDNHHRRRGEKVINKEDIKEQEPNDQKTGLTTSRMTSSIIHHIWTCAISQKPSEFRRKMGFINLFVLDALLVM